MAAETSVPMETLSRKLEETHHEIAQVRGEVVEALRAFYAQSSGFSADDAIKIASKWSNPPSNSVGGGIRSGGQSELQEKLQRLNGELLETVDGLQLDGAAPQAALVASFAQRERMKKQMQQSRAMIALIERLTDVDRRIMEADAAIEQRRFVAAAEGIAAVERLIADLLAEEAADDSEIVQSIRLELVKKKNRLLSQLKQFYTCSVVWSEGSLKLVASTSMSLGPPDTNHDLRDELRDFWKACGVLDLLSPRLKDVAKAISQQLVKPMLQMPNATIEHTRDNVRSGSTLFVRHVGAGQESSRSSRAEGSGVADAQDMCANVVGILLFVHAELFAGSAELMNRLGDVLWKIPGNLEAMLMGLLRDKIPQDAQSLNAYRDVLTMTVTELENKLVAVGFSACSNSQLREFVSQLNQLHSKKRREHVLCCGRDLMRRGYNDSVKIDGTKEKCSLPGAPSSGGKKGKSGGKAGPGVSSGGATSMASGSLDDVEGGCFDMPNYRVSVVSRDVVEMTHETLVEACAAEPASAKLLFQTSRDLLFLFRAVVPTLYADDIANDARACMLFHNDCLYIAHHMLTIGYLYKQRLPSPLSQTATMIDMVPGLRNAGEKALVSFATSQTDELVSGAAALPPLRDVDSDRTAGRIEDFLKGVLYKLNRISASWREGLPVAVYKRVTARMLEPLVAKFVDAVLAEPVNTKISANAGAHLHHLLSLLLECESLFDSPAQAETHVASLARLRKLTALLADPIATVRDKVRASSLSEFSRSELVHLAKSLYRESPEQQALLHELAQA